MYVLYLLPNRPGQLITSLPDDEIEETLYHAMPNMWGGEMVEQGYNNKDGPIHTVVEFFQTTTEM